MRGKHILCNLSMLSMHTRRTKMICSHLPVDLEYPELTHLCMRKDKGVNAFMMRLLSLSLSGHGGL